MDTPSVKSLTGSSCSNSSSSSSANSSSNERRTTPKSKSGDSNEASSKLNFKPYELSSKSKSSDAEKSDKGTPASQRSRSSPGNPHNSPDPPKQQSNSASSSAPLSYTTLGLPDMHKDSLAAFYKAYGFLSPNCCPTVPGSPYGSLMPPPMTLDKTGAYPSIYPPTPSATAAAAIAAYNYNFARVKHGNMGGMMPAASNHHLCRDPYCGGACAQFGPQFHNSHAALLAASQASAMALRESAVNGSQSGQSLSGSTCTPSSCPNGCSQCEHHRYMAAIAAAYGNSFSGLAPQMPYSAQMSAASYASSLATAAAMHHRATSAAGFMCNWVVGGDTQCGKKFATAEELLQHLKSHAASSQNSESRASPSTATSTALTSVHLSTSSSPGSHSAQGNHPNSGTASPLSHSTRHSSNSSGAAVSPSQSMHNSGRYHPYSKPISSVAPSLPPSALPNGPFPMGGSAYAPPFGLPPSATSLSSFPAANMYYPYMSYMSGRIGPPVPP